MWKFCLGVCAVAEAIFSTSAMVMKLDSSDTASNHFATNGTGTATAGEQLLVLTNDGLHLISLQSNSSALLLKGVFTDVAYESVHGEIVTLVEYKNNKQGIIFWDTNNEISKPTSLRLTPEPCWKAWEFKNESNRAVLVSFDWIWRNLYVVTSCGYIHICNIVSLNCSAVLVVDRVTNRKSAILVHQRAGPVGYIHRANMDGTSLTLIVETLGGILGVALDDENSRLYWTDQSSQILMSCDMYGNIHRFEDSYVQDAKLLFNVVGIHRERIYSTRTLAENSILVQRKTSMDRGVRLWSLSQVSPKEGTRQALLRRDQGRQHLASDPCSNNQCTQVCVPSGNNTARSTCLGEKVKLLVTTIDAVLIIALNGSSSWNDVTRIQNLSEPRGISHDFEGGCVFWSEELDGVTVVKKRSLVDGLTNALLTHAPPHLMLNEELQVMAYDWITGNMYMVHRNTRRIYVCNVTAAPAQSCTEILINKVAADVGGLALNPLHAKMYWTERDGQSPSLTTAKMDGSDYTFLRTKGLELPGGIAVDIQDPFVLWVDAGRRHIVVIDITKNYYNENKQFQVSSRGYLPQHVGLHKNGIYWAGSEINGENAGIFFKNRRDVDELVVNFSRTSIRGFQVYSLVSQPRHGRKNDCQNHSCQGICLLSSSKHFQCACPVGTRAEKNGGTSCEDLEDPHIIYSTENGVFVRNESDMNDYAIYLGRRTVQSIAYSVDRRLIWIADGEKIWDMEEVAFNETRHQFDLIRGGIRSRSLRYDWIGNNLYYLTDPEGEAVICSCASHACVNTDLRVGTRRWEAQIALDPSLGFMYWCHGNGMKRADMDGSNGRNVFHGCTEGPIAVDPETHFLFWCDGHFEIRSADPFGNNVRSLASLSTIPRTLAVAGQSVFWVMNFGGTRLYSCGKEICDNLRGRKLSRVKHMFVTDAFMGHAGSQPTKRKDPCSGGLCSHICVPTSTDYMRCLCPAELKLSSNGRNCECRHGTQCTNIRTEGERSGLLPALPAVGSGRDCSAGDTFRCSNSAHCINKSQVCDGRGDCPDFSDEGSRCNEPCQQDYGCSYECIPTPNGSACVCPPGETLDGDQKKCVYLKIQNVKPTSFPIALLGAALVVLLILSTVALVKYQQAKKRIRNLTPEEVDKFLRGDPSASDFAPDGGEKALALPFTHVLEPDSLIIAGETAIGSGEFGVVHAGSWNNSVPVAVKTFKRTLDVDEFKAVLAEVKIMAYLGDHEHVIKFLGSDVSEITERKIKVVTELSPHGDLLRYLWKLAPRSQIVQVQIDNANYSVCQKEGTAPTAEIATSDLVNWCEQVADGMEYLTAKKIIHGDLAARNVLVFSNNVLKISDFGMSKKLYACGHYRMKRQVKLPWRSASIELLTNGELSEASDVWSFGVTAWEIFTFGQSPYAGMCYSHQFIRYLEQGNRLAQPQEASENIYKVLLQCWDAQMSARPTFAFLKVFFREQMLATTGSTGQAVGSSYTEAV